MKCSCSGAGECDWCKHVRTNRAGRCSDCEALEKRVAALERALGLMMLAAAPPEDPAESPEWQALLHGEPLRFRFLEGEGKVVVAMCTVRRRTDVGEQVDRNQN